LLFAVVLFWIGWLLWVFLVVLLVVFLPSLLCACGFLGLLLWLVGGAVFLSCSGDSSCRVRLPLIGVGAAVPSVLFVFSLGSSGSPLVLFCFGGFGVLGVVPGCVWVCVFLLLFFVVCYWFFVCILVCFFSFASVFFVFCVFVVLGLLVFLCWGYVACWRFWVCIGLLGCFALGPLLLRRWSAVLFGGGVFFLVFLFCLVLARVFWVGSVFFFLFFFCLWRWGLVVFGFFRFFGGCGCMVWLGGSGFWAWSAAGDLVFFVVMPWFFWVALVVFRRGLLVL